MDIQDATVLFDALSQETRLRVFRLLVKAGTAGMPAGLLSEILGTPHNTMSFHLQQLSHAGLLTSKKEGRSVIYTANFARMQELIGFLVADCCSADMAKIREDKVSGYSIIELASCCPGDEHKSTEKVK
ncbi:MAG: metalloregulator ArsR/SmtB family transcription factor [Pseudohongiellaceae bacterium]